MEASGFFSEEHGVTQAPVIRIGVGFGRGQVVGTTAIIDTGSDLCVFPASLFRWEIPARGELEAQLEMADGTLVPAPVRYPSVTAGGIREVAVASVVLPVSPPILGRSFLNRVDLRVAARLGLVRLHTVRA